MQSVQQTNLIKPTCKPAPAKDHIFSTAGTKTAQGQTQPNPAQHPMEWTVRKKSMIQSGQLQAPRKQSTELARGTVAL